MFAIDDEPTPTAGVDTEDVDDIVPDSAADVAPDIAPGITVDTDDSPGPHTDSLGGGVLDIGAGIDTDPTPVNGVPMPIGEVGRVTTNAPTNAPTNATIDDLALRVASESPSDPTSEASTDQDTAQDSAQDSEQNIGSGTAAARSVVEPTLPEPGSNRRPATVPHGRRHRPARARYRSDSDRSRSVHRLANPLPRRFARLIVGAVIVAMVGGGLYLGVREFEQWWNRDRLPSIGADTPTIRATSFRIDSEAPAPALDGTLTIDAETGAFEFVGSDDGPHAGWHVISPDGDRIVARLGDDRWETADETDRVATDASIAAGFLAKSHNVDRILSNAARRHVELVQQSTDVTAAGELTRYDLLYDTRAFSRTNLLEWTEFRRDAIPGVTELAALPVTVWVDERDVLVRVVDDTSGWRWERLADVDEPFQPTDPTS